MVRNDHVLHPRRFENLRAGLSALQATRRRSAADPEKVKIFRGCIFLLITLCLGWSASTVSGRNAIHEYQSTRWPKDYLWGSSLASFGLKSETPGNQPKLVSSHPAPFSDDSSIWYEPEQDAVYIPKSPFNSIGNPELWLGHPNAESSPTKSKPKWIKLGSGWAGFESLLEKLKKRPRVVETPAKSHSKWVDPKEIRY